ncbi:MULTISPECIES: resolvase [Clostridium]|uniref:resolvase n=1 Tax=Clostridium TaxID=1485 RepID=UPI001EF18B91|nr:MULTISPECIES: resolvase [Clostridium]
MANQTTNELQERVNSYKEKVELLTKDNARLYKEIKDIKADTNAISSKEYDILLDNMELLKSELEKYKNLYFREKQKSKVHIVKKSKIVGRKPVSDELRNKVLDLKKQGSNIRSIAKELNIALGIVHKIINEQK